MSIYVIQVVIRDWTLKKCPVSCVVCLHACEELNSQYHVNKKHPIYNELKSIIMKTSGIVKRLKESLSLIDNIDIALIYGSFASGESTSASDIDVMIIGDPEAPEIAGSIRELETKFDREINFTLYTKDEFLKKKNKIEFLKEVMKKKKNTTDW